MANQFIGLYMRVVLREPPGYRLIGKVQDVAAGTSLTLVDGMCCLVPILCSQQLTDTQQSLMSRKMGVASQ